MDSPLLDNGRLTEETIKSPFFALIMGIGIAWSPFLAYENLSAVFAGQEVLYHSLEAIIEVIVLLFCIWWAFESVAEAEWRYLNVLMILFGILATALWLSS